MTSLLDGGNDLPQIDPDKDYFEELVGDGKKFKSPQELAKGKAESDIYIKTLEQRADALRDDYLKLKQEADTAARLQTLIDQMSKKEDDHTNNNPSLDDVNDRRFDPAEIDNIVTRKLQDLEAQRRETTNWNQVQNKLQEAYGDKAASVLKQQVSQLGLPGDYADNLAKTSPDAFYRVFGLDQQRQTEDLGLPPRSQNTFTPATNKRNWEYYENMRRTDPVKYHDPKTSVQMHRDVIDIGEAKFYGA